MVDKFKYENVLHVLVNHSNSSSKQTERVLANNLLANFSNIPNISIERLADLCYVSQPTLTRFIKKLGYKNYNQFKRYVVSLVNIIENETASDLFKVDKENPIESHYSKLVNSLSASVELFRTEDFENACRKIHDAKRVAILGIDYSQVVAFDAQLRFMRYDKHLETGVTCVEQLEVITNLQPGDALIVLSVSGVTNGLENVTNQLAPGVECILITSNAKPVILEGNPNLEVIQISQKANQLTNTSQHGRFNLLFAIDILYITYGQMYHSVCRKDKL